ncbi:TatD family hydrolase [Neobacillus ginsengisoli]|nr:TatD family hydrolase [Neobacillus ginsengisoli]
MIDAHIHLDHYKDEEINSLMGGSSQIEILVSVSFDLESCKRNLYLSRRFSRVKPAFGFHPEQPLPTGEDLNELLVWMEKHREEMFAIGEVGLPYYQRLDQKVSKQDYCQYMKLLESFILKAKIWEKPIVLHAVYDDAPIVCDLLEKHSVRKAHFHWFKGDDKTVERMAGKGYFISVTPDVVYEEEIQQLVRRYPLEQMMVETDGPWPFGGPFQGQMTNPNMMMESIKMIAKLKKRSNDEVAGILIRNTKFFYNLT